MPLSFLFHLYLTMFWYSAEKCANSHNFSKTNWIRSDILFIKTNICGIALYTQLEITRVSTETRHRQEQYIYTFDRFFT